ncbi:MAG: hypothetical protein WED05_02660 [Candidatus Atabeyarchaeum deiterrae]
MEKKSIEELFEKWRHRNRIFLLGNVIFTVFAVVFLVVFSSTFDSVAFRAMEYPFANITISGIPIAYVNALFKFGQIFVPFMIGVIWENYRSSKSTLHAAQSDVGLLERILKLEAKTKKGKRSKSKSRARKEAILKGER